MPSSLTSSSQQAQTTNHSTTDPWAPQAGALTTAFQGATDAYGNVKANGPAAPTDFTAQMTPEQLTTFRSMIAQGGNAAVPNQTSGTGSTLQAAGSNGVAGSLSGLSAYDPSGSNNADSIVANANKYAAGQDIPAAVRAAMQGATETARDVTMPGIEQNAAIGGNTNSSRTGVADGLVQRALAEQAGTLSATLKNKAYTDGLSLAEKQAEANNTGALTALTGQGVIGNTAATGGVNACFGKFGTSISVIRGQGFQ